MTAYRLFIGLALAVVARTRVAHTQPNFVPQLPVPRGPYAVGTGVFYLTDSSRVDPSAADATMKRRLIVQIWYPALPDSTYASTHYLTELSALKTVYGGAADALAMIDTHAR